MRRALALADVVAGKPVGALSSTFATRTHPMRLLLLAASLLAIQAIPVVAQASLVINGGNDEPLIGGEIQSWTEVVGSSWGKPDLSLPTTTFPQPQDGDSYFYAGNTAFSELAQRIDVSSFQASIESGTQEFRFGGYVRSFPATNPDRSRIIVEYEDAEGNVLEFFDSGTIADNNWQFVADRRLAPVSTRFIEIRLQADRNSGTSNDGYFDSISLEGAVTVPEPSTPAILAAGVMACLVSNRRRRCGSDSRSIA